MKPLLTIAFAILSMTLIAQDWAPYTGDTIHYSSEGKYYPDLSIYELNSFGDTTYFNRIIDSCHTCSGAGIFNYNQPVFLGYEMVNNNDSLFEFFGADTFSILPHQAIDSAWDYGNGRVAKFTEARLDTLFGATDSVKVGFVDATEMFILSKNYGLVKLPDLVRNSVYDLVGIEGGIGFQDMKFRDAWNLKVGDVIQYTSRDAQSFEWDYVYAYEEIVLEILPSTPGLYKYRALGGTWNGTGSQEYTQTINGASFLHDLSGSYVSLNAGWSSNLFGKVHYKEDDEWGLLKTVGTEYNWNPSSLILVAQANGSLYAYYDNNLFSVAKEYSFGPGLINDGYEYFETIESFKVTYYATDSATYGTYRNIVSIENQDLASIDLYPNPTQNIIHIAELTNQKESTLEVYNVLGELVISKEIEEPSSFNGLDVSEIQTGVYSVVVRCEGVVVGHSKMLIE